MPVNLNLPAALPVGGVELATVSAGVKPDGTADLVLIKLAETCNCAAVFTQNAFCAAPVTICKKQLQSNGGLVRALLINSGNANAGTGQAGIDMAEGHCDAVASSLSLPRNSVLPFSTGVIGQLLPDDIMRAGIAKAASAIKESGAQSNASSTSDRQAWENAARGIMTTDTQPKLTSQAVDIEGQQITITGMAKGAGMIQPNMATMLSYVFTNAKIDVEHLDVALRSAVDVSFNAITVDSDTSTNDATVLVASGVGPSMDPAHAQWREFMSALTTVCVDLAQAIIRDAEGATKFITVRVEGGKDIAECKRVGYSVANSPLVKTAMFASDANVGRLLMAIGKADVPSLDASLIKVSLGDVVAFEATGIAKGYTEERGAAVMAQDEIEVVIDLARGEASASIYTSDLSHDYVSINADYRS